MPRTREYWLQIENHPWDAAPWGVDRTTGQPLPRKGTGGFLPASREVLTIRRYAPDFAAPADQPLNPWDLNEPDPLKLGGTVPGAVIEAKVADEILVHFRNQDTRRGIPSSKRIHSLHPHGVQRSPEHNGVFPLSPTDPSQGGKRGDRVAPGETFTYRWTCPQRAAAGVWLYQDGSGPWLESLRLGAFGALIIRAPGEQAPDMPKGALRRAGDTTTAFASVPIPPKRGEYLLVFHELPGIGLCLNGRQVLGNTPSLVAGEGTRMSVRCLNAASLPLSVNVQGHRWESGGRWVDVELLPPGGGTTMEILSGSSEGGGGLGEWPVTGRSGNAEVSGTLVTTAGGKVSLVS